MRKLLLALSFLLAFTSCATVTKMTGSFTTCEKANLGVVIQNLPSALAADLAALSIPASSSILTMVEGLVSANGPALEADLGMLVATVGVDTLDCAVTAIEAVFATGSGSAGSAAARTSIAAPGGLARARAYINAVRAAGAM